MLVLNACTKYLFRRDLKGDLKYNQKTKIIPDTINVGGGFPSIYPDLKPEPLENYFKKLNVAWNNLKLKNCQR